MKLKNMGYPLASLISSNVMFFSLVVITFMLVASVTSRSFGFSSFSTIREEGQEKNEESMALFKWKTNMDKKNQTHLSSWVMIDSTTSNHCRTWVGISCNKAGRVDSITVSNLGLRGKLSDLNFSIFHHLETIDLSNNQFHGFIPAQLGSLDKLSALVLSINNLSGQIPFELCQLTNLKYFYIDENQISGLIPKNLGLLRSLKELVLSSNQLSDPFPASIVKMSNLTSLYLFNNKINGPIPEEIGCLRSLLKLSLGSNKITGLVPTSIGELTNLTRLNLWGNQLGGPIPHEIGNLRFLVRMDLSSNNLTGSIPNTIGNLVYLSSLLLNNNKLVGSIPHEIASLRSLVDLVLLNNSLTGTIPDSIGELSNLKNLYLRENHLEGPLPNSLNNLTKLELFDISDNKLTGQLPHNICLGGYLKYYTVEKNNLSGPIPESLKTCTSLERLRLGKNLLSGNISEDFGIYPILSYVDLSDNNFHGVLSQNWVLCPNLTSLKISNNNLSGSIPSNIGQAPKLQLLDLSSNNLIREIPKKLGKLLLVIDLSNNNLSGKIPVEISGLSNLETLNLAGNNLSGSLPKQLGQVVKLLHLNVSRNRLVENIPFEIGNLRSLMDLDLAQNFLLGEIPQQIGLLLMLLTLDISHNQLSGLIPSTLENLLSLETVDISHNRLEDPLPNIRAFQSTSFDMLKDNKGLCGNITGLKTCPMGIKDWRGRKMKTNSMILVIVLTMSCSLLFLLVLFGISISYKRRSGKETPAPRQDENEDIFQLWGYNGTLVYEKIIEATENFDARYCIGVGGSGAVYKVFLPNSQVVAVKKLHLLENGELDYHETFTREIHVLTEIRHRNIIKLYGFCSNPRHLLLVYQFLEGGDLERILRYDEEAISLQWANRIDIIKGVANGLAYMHHECSPPIVHRDISSKNILLNSQYLAHISNFGTAKILETCSSNWTSSAGTIGYTAPEVAYGVQVDERQDVYSFGVLALEVLMGCHPGNLVSYLPNSLSSITETMPCEVFSTQLKDVLDPRLPVPKTNLICEEIVCAARLAFSCLQAHPHRRPTMRQVSAELSKHRLLPVEHSFYRITLGQLLDHSFLLPN